MTGQRVSTSSDIPTGSGDDELLGLIRSINHELDLCLRVRMDANSTVVTGEDKWEELGRHICFALAGKQWAVPLSAVMEVGELQLVRSLPLLPDWLTGITNIRGEILSVVNLALFLGYGNGKEDSASARSFLVVHDKEIKIVVTVDRVVGTRLLYRPSMKESGQGSVMSAVDFFSGRASYEEQGTAKEIDLFNMDGFLSSRKLRNVANG